MYFTDQTTAYWNCDKCGDKFKCVDLKPGYLIVIANELWGMSCEKCIAKVRNKITAIFPHKPPIIPS